MDEKKTQVPEEEEEEEVITLVDESGNEADFYEIATLDYKEKWYIVLEPAEQTDGFEEGEVIIYELGEDEKGDETFIPIEDEETLENVFAEFQKMLDEEDSEDEGDSK